MERLISSSGAAAQPDLNRVVDGARHEDASSQVECRHEVRVSVDQLFDAARRGQVPHAHGLVVAAAEQVLAAAHEHDVVHPVIMAHQCDQTPA